MAISNFLESVFVSLVRILSLSNNKYWDACYIDLMALTIKQIEKISKALGDSNRLRILQHITKKGGCGQCADIQEESELTQPSVSHHIKVLIEAGIIEPEKEGRNHKYNLNEKVLKEYSLAVSLMKFS